MSLAKLTLAFERHDNGPVQLRWTSFKRQDMEQPLRAERGAYDGTFKWSSGVKALMVFLLRSAAEALREADLAEGDAASPYVLHGKRPSPAASLNDVLTKRPAWVYDVFGTTEGSLPFLGELVRRQNPDFTAQPQESVSLWLDPSRFPAAGIEVTLNGRVVTDLAVLDQLAEEIVQQWRPRRAVAPLAGAKRDMASIIESLKSFCAEGTEQYMGMLLELSHDDVVLECAGVPELGISGAWQGRQAVMDAAMGNYAKFDYLDVQIHTLLGDDHTIVVMAQERARLKSTPTVHVVEWVHRLTFADGKIVKAKQLVAVSPEAHIA